MPNNQIYLPIANKISDQKTGKPTKETFETGDEPQKTFSNLIDELISGNWGDTRLCTSVCVCVCVCVLWHVKCQSWKSYLHVNLLLGSQM